MNTPALQTGALALNFQTGIVPEWVHVLPAGPQIAGRDGRVWRLLDASVLQRALDVDARDIPIDFEHSSEIVAAQGLEAPAAGWIKELDIRSDGVWGRVEWTESGAIRVAERSYRYVSPVFYYNSAGDISKIVSVGLTNSPNLKLIALNRAQGVADGEPEEKAPMKLLLEALGLTENATETEALKALNVVKDDRQKALNRAEMPDPARFVPKTDHEKALNRVTELEAGAAEREAEKVDAAIDAAIEAGKVAPASRDHYLAMCRQNGLEAFTSLAATLPVIGGGGGAAKKTGAADVTAGQAKALNSVEKDVARALGISETDYAAAKAAEETDQ